MLEGHSLFQASKLSGLQVPKRFFVFCHLSSLCSSANPFLTEFLHHKFFHFTLTVTCNQMSGTDSFEQGFGP